MGAKLGSLLLREEHRLRMFWQKGARENFSTEQKDEVTGGRRRLHNEELRYKPEGRRFETRWDPMIYLVLPAALGPGVYLACNRNEYQK
jgi:hypothetical protein